MPETCDLLVIGGGIAGGACALRAADMGLNVVALVKSQDPAETNTGQAQGGIVAEGDDDPPPLLVNDILEAGDQVGWRPAAEQLAAMGPDLGRDLLAERLQVPFDRTPEGKLSFTEEAAHSRRRIVHVGDWTGRAIQEKLTKALKGHPKIRLVANATAIDLITRSHHDPDPTGKYVADRVMGAYVFDETRRQVETYFAESVVLATGGLGQIFLHSTNPSGATGDGIAMATRAGIPIRDLEYVQFHPTAYFSPQGERFLVSEAVRGEGAWLLNAKGERFMKRYVGEAQELAPRDEVARAIHEELSATGAPCVYLDIANHNPGKVEIPKRFPKIHAFLAEQGIDMAAEPIPVVPAAHYSCGGVLVDLTGRVRQIEGLYAVGEVSCTGLHGANRLASTSLLEGLVWGWRAGESAATRRDQASLRELPAIRERIPAWDASGLEDEADPLLVRQDWITLRHIMWNYAGIVRTAKRLRRAVDDLSYLAHRVESFYRTTHLTRGLIELRNGVITSLAVAQAALTNRRSFGCHFRKD